MSLQRSQTNYFAELCSLRYYNSAIRQWQLFQTKYRRQRLLMFSAIHSNNMQSLQKSLTTWCSQFSKNKFHLVALMRGIYGWKLWRQLLTVLWMRRFAMYNLECRSFLRQSQVDHNRLSLRCALRVIMVHAVSLSSMVFLPKCGEPTTDRTVVHSSERIFLFRLFFCQWKVSTQYRHTKIFEGNRLAPSITTSDNNSCKEHQQKNSLSRARPRPCIQESLPMPLHPRRVLMSTPNESEDLVNSPSEIRKVDMKQTLAAELLMLVSKLSQKLNH